MLLMEWCSVTYGCTATQLNVKPWDRSTHDTFIYLSPLARDGNHVKRLLDLRTAQRIFIKFLIRRASTETDGTFKVQSRLHYRE
jgi:hypothetical protein